MKIKEALLLATKELSSFVERPRLEAEILLGYLLGVSREYLLINDNKEIQEQAFFKLIKRRKNYEPIEYITNKVSFWDFELFINKGALIPRPESEILVEKALELIKKHTIKKVAEIGIGSGALSIAIAKEADVAIEASDISKEAINIAQKNIEDFALQDKIEVKQCSLLDSLNTPELLISNPPYIDPNVQLEANVANFEPHSALFAPKRGCEILFQILDLIKEKEILFAVCEMGYDQKDAIAEYAKEIGLGGALKFYKDLAGLDRGFVFER